ncbi:MAG: EVE domain-containing protein, partial [Gemmatimonadota bacterium]
MPRHWLVKSEPGSYSLDDLQRDGSTYWDGVRNYQARNLMREMRIGDLVLFYHSNADPPGVAGIAEVVREAYPDPSAWNPDS